MVMTETLCETVRRLRTAASGPRAVRAGFLVGALAAQLVAFAAQAASLSETIKTIKPSIVAVGTYQATRRPPARVLGSGFVVGGGRHVLTNAHVLPDVLDSASRERLSVFAGRGAKAQGIAAKAVAIDRDYDLAVLELEGRALPALRFGDSTAVEEGDAVAFTGFPIGSVLGLHPVTHTGVVSAVTPIVIPAPSAEKLNPRMIRRMNDPYEVFQLDATAYPGNSGSPLFDPGTGAVIGVVNKVFVKDTKESLLERPSGITYAIPIHHARALMERAGVRDGSP